MTVRKQDLKKLVTLEKDGGLKVIVSDKGQSMRAKRPVYGGLQFMLRDNQKGIIACIMTIKAAKQMKRFINRINK